MESHLLGAYSYAVSKPIDFSRPGLTQAGAWNYLREEITVGLVRRRPVRIAQIFDDHVESAPNSVMPSNYIAYLLAQIINFCFTDTSYEVSIQNRRERWRDLRASLERWKEDLPSSFQPFSVAAKSDNPFPSIWMLQPWHGMLTL